MNRIKSGVLLLVAAGLLAACAEERAPIDRVQPYALPKTFFIGEDFQSLDDDPEFWSQTTLVDVGYGAKQDGLFTSTYAQPMSRLFWEIQENLLIGRAAYERIDKSDGKGKETGLQTHAGNVVVAFAITSQFDIVNAYNSTTGEKLNVVEENSYDRPWTEREYIRVDFSKNLQADSYDFDTASMIGVYGSIVYEPLSYYVADPNAEEAPYFDFDENYFDITTKVFAKPGLIDLSDLGWGIDNFPACFLDLDFRGGTSPSGTCNPVEITLRQSFRKVVDNDFEPQNMDGWRFQAYGAFAFAERRGYDRQYGMTDNEYYRFKSTFPIWERSHYYEDPEAMTGAVECYNNNTTPAGASPHRDLIGGGADGQSPDGTEDECQAVKNALDGLGGSKCDEFTQKCTLPYRARTPKPMAWYYTNKSDRRFYEPSAYAAQQWDAALRSAVATAFYTECMAEALAETTDPDAIAGAKAECSRGIDTDDDGTKDGWMPYFGQQDSNDDLLFLSQEMDDCRSARTHSEITSEVGSEEREAACAEETKAKGAALGETVEEGVISQAIAPEMIVFCHSPVEAGDHALCAPEEERLPEGLSSWDCADARAAGDREMLDTCLAARNVRLGDLRYHVVNVIESPQTPSPWGIMTSAIDPTNGETVASCTNIWSFVNDFWAQRVVDWMRYAAGEISSEEVTEGQNIKEWSLAAESAARGGVFPTMTRAERDRRVASAVGALVDDKQKAAAKQLKSSGEVDKFLKALTVELTGFEASAEVAGENAARYRTRMNSVAGTQLETELMNTQMQQLHGVENIVLTDGVLDLVSPMRGGNPAFRREIKRLKQNALGERGMCELEMADTPVSIVGLSNILQQKFGNFNAADSAQAQFDRARRMAAYIMKYSHASVLVHEMGHSIGHRHNFVSSSDAWNYRPQYWALRTKGNTLETVSDNLCEDLSADGEDCVGPRYFDPVTQEETDNLIWMWSYSSIMDYAGETTQDFQTLGAWDWAAARAMYGDSVPVYPLEYFKYDAAHSAATQYATFRRQMVYEKLDNFGGIVGFNYTLPSNVPVNYTNLNNMLNLIPVCETIDPQIYKPSRWNDLGDDGEWSPLLDGFIVNVNGSPTRCRQQKVDYVRWPDLGVPADASIASYMRALGEENGVPIGWVTDKFTRARVPYGFASDNWADIGNASVYRHDNGADTYEIFNFLASQQELFSIFDNYRRGISTFTMTGATSRIMDRYIAKMRDGAKGIAMQKNFLSVIGTNAGVGGDALWDYAAKNWYPENVVSSTLVFDHFVRNAQRPAPGPHGIPVEGPYSNAIYPDDEDFGPCQALWVGSSVCDPAGIVPNGAYATTTTGNGFLQMAAGGKVVENQLSTNHGDYDSGYTITAGSYYDKISMAMMMTESVDNFISESRGDFIDKRYRSVSLADLFPDGYRRWIGNMLTNDTYLKGPRVEVDGAGMPLQDEDGFWAGGIGWTKWWGEEVEACFPKDGTNICDAYVDGAPVDLDAAPASVMPIDPEFAWEVQKFLVADTYIYLPENNKAWWLDQMWITLYDALEADIVLDNMIEFKNPNGALYLAKRYGQEDIFGRTVEKGVAARVLQYANELLSKAYETTPVYSDGSLVETYPGEAPVWYEPVMNEDNTYTVLYDEWVDGGMGGTGSFHPADCSETDNSGCTCSMNRYCVELADYISVLNYMAAWSGVADFNPNDESNEKIGIW